jgi:hypothetical protein
VTIKKGKVTIAVEGIKGSGCQAATAELEKKLGKTFADTHTDEMYLTPDTTVTQS